ncbi:flagellar biosynthetic protein FliO [Phenylobacterium sp.]|uniref:flagellar biosynthetic protein FliO n=1 Tax=Phenylobacterium sp. TaxID=1871053 RepID=UPI0028114950|nr:flagellar biosynthetic protein FliO [Phenylobacterium sp.]
MNFVDFLRAVFALALTLGLVGLAAVALRRYGPQALARFGQPQRRERRMRVVESLVLDPARRLLIVECDGQERLLLLGEGRLLGETRALPGSSAAQPDAR